MAENEQDKSNAKKVPHIESAELFEALYREELKNISADPKKKSVSKRDGRGGAVTKAKSPSQVKVVGRKKAGVQTASEKRDVVRRDSTLQVQVGTSKKAPSRTDASMRRAAEQKRGLRIGDGPREELRPEEIENNGETEGAAMGFGGEPMQNSDKLKIALLCVVLVVAVGFIINSLGIVDFGSLLGLSGPTEKRSMKSPVVNKPPGKKPATVVAKSPQETTTPSVPERMTSQMRRRIVEKPPETTTPFANPGAAQRPSKRILPTRPRGNTQRLSKRHAPTQEPVVTQESTTRSTSTPAPMVAKAPVQPSPSMQDSVIARRDPEPAISEPNLNVPDQPAESTTIDQRQPDTKTPAQPLNPKQGTTAAKDPTQASTPRIQPNAVHGTSGAAEPAGKEATLGKQEIPAEDSDLSYPYSVYLGSYKTRGKAAKAISDYQSKGLSAYWVKVDLAQKGIWYRVFVGRFKTRDSAKVFIREKGLADAEVMETKHVAPKYAYSATDGKLKKEESKKEEPLSTATASSYPYSIYFGSYQSRELADEGISEYRKKGLSPYWVKIDLGDKGVWYRVFSEYFEKRGQADEFIARNQIAGAKSRHTRYANLIGVFASQKALDDEKIRLSEFGWCPYVIPGSNGQSRLYVGAFYQKARAERQHAELSSRGIHSEMAER